jgi:Carboxypeptidase regulatory-like domain/TonB dependent receptor
LTKRTLLCCIGIVSLFCSASLRAQKDAASLEGRVVDSRGAVVASASVTAVNVDTSLTYRAQSNSNGEWAISPVRIGTYRIQITATGFKSSIEGPLTLDVQQRQRVDVALQPGAVSENVVVSATSPLIQTDSSELGQVVDSQTMVGIPLNGRNPVQLAQLTVGVTVSEPGARDAGGFGFSASGSRSLDNNFLLDGIDNNSNLPDLLNEANYVVMPPPDALQEFKIETGNYDAEFGRATGAIVNATTRSGSNQFHGVLYEFLRNQKLDANNYFNSASQPYHQNQFGATLGGRIIRDKLFFFVDYEGLRISQAQPATALVPTQAQRNGDFSSQLDLTSPTGTPDCNGQPTYQGELFDTTLTQATAGGFCGVPFGYVNGAPSNVIPASRIDPLGKTLINLFPAPNANGLGYNYLSNPVLSQTVNQGDARVDQIFSAKDSAFYRFSASRSPEIIPSPFPGVADGGGFFDGIQQVNGYSAAVSEAHVFSTSKVNELRLGYNRVNTSRFQQNYKTNVSEEIGFPGVPFTPTDNNGGLPQLTFNDSSTLGSPTYLPAIELQNTYTVSDTFTLISGNKTWKFGGEIRPEENTIYEPANPRGAIAFNTQFTDNAGDPGSGGSGLATLLTGQPNNGNINNLNNIDYFRHTYSLFAQNDWRITPKLNLNLGVRYEYFSPVYERFNAQASFNPITGNLDIPRSSNVTLPASLSYLPVNHNASNALIPRDYINFSPRIGLAYQISPKLTTQSAFGVFFNGDEDGPYSNPSPGFNPPYFDSQVYVTPCSLPSYNNAAQNCSVPGLSVLSQGFPANALSEPNTPSLFSLDTNLRTPYVMQWHLTFQYQLDQNTMLESSYVGSKSNKEYIFFNLNQAAPTADPSAAYDTRRPYPYVNAAISYLKSGGFSNYNALQLSLQHRLTHGLSLIMNYTYSKALGNSSSANLGAQNNDAFRYAYTPNIEYGSLDFDVRNRFVTSFIYQLPFGQGQRFGGGSGAVLDHVIGHWTVSGLLTLSSGTWFTVTDGNGNFANSDGQQRPDAVPGQKATGKPCVAGTFFNTCAFQNPALGSFGDIGLNSLQGPGDKNFDFAVEKIIPLREKLQLELRAEAFNALNHPNFLFAAPGPQNSNNATVFGTPSFGFVTAAQSPREIQFAAKLHY